MNDTVEQLLPSAEEVALLASKPKPYEPGPLKRLSDRHRGLAKSLAAGTKQGDAALMWGYTAPRVSTMMHDPSFKALIEFYRAQREEQFVGAARKLATVAETAIDILQDRLEDSSDDISTSTLLDVIKTSTDRTGLGPTSRHEHVHAVLSVEDLQRLKTETLGSSAKLVELLPAQQAGQVRSAADELSALTSEGEEGSSEEGTEL